MGDEAREKLFDYGHAGLYRSRADPRVGVVRGVTRKSERMTDGLLEFLKSHNPASTSLHWLTPNLCLAAGAGIRQVNNAPISHMGAHDGDAYMYDQLGAQIRELIAWAQKTQK